MRVLIGLVALGGLVAASCNSDSAFPSTTIPPAALPGVLSLQVADRGTCQGPPCDLRLDFDGPNFVISFTDLETTDRIDGGSGSLNAEGAAAATRAIELAAADGTLGSDHPCQSGDSQCPTVTVTVARDNDEAVTRLGVFDQFVPNEPSLAALQGWIVTVLREVRACHASLYLNTIECATPSRSDESAPPSAPAPLVN